LILRRIEVSGGFISGKVPIGEDQLTVTTCAAVGALLRLDAELATSHK